MEKPLAVDLPSAVRIAAAARTAGLTTCVGYHWFHSGAIGTMTPSCVLDRRHQVDLHLVLEGRSLDLRERALSDHDLRTETRDGEQTSRSTEDPIATEDRTFVDPVLGHHGQTPVSYDEVPRTHALVCAADRSAQEGGRVVDDGPNAVWSWCASR